MWIQENVCVFEPNGSQSYLNLPHCSSRHILHLVLFSGLVQDFRRFSSGETDLRSQGPRC